MTAGIRSFYALLPWSAQAAEARLRNARSLFSVKFEVQEACAISQLEMPFGEFAKFVRYGTNSFQGD
jgi:hypothetical protein